MEEPPGRIQTESGATKGRAGGGGRGDRVCWPLGAAAHREGKKQDTFTSVMSNMYFITFQIVNNNTAVWMKRQGATLRRVVHFFYQTLFETILFVCVG